MAHLLVESGDEGKLTSSCKKPTASALCEKVLL